MIISPRLQAIANNIISGLSLADIGTDHAYLPAYLLLNKQIPKAIASDIKQGPLNKAQETVDEFQLQDIELRLGGGLSTLREGEVEQITIAGMGGEMIAKILDDHQAISSNLRRLVLQPMGQVDELRKYLNNNGFKIILEEICSEKTNTQHYYTIIVAEPGNDQKYSEFEYYYGKPEVIIMNEDYFEFIHFLIEKIKDRIQRMSHSDNTRTVKRRLDFERRLSYLKDILNESLKNSTAN